MAEAQRKPDPDNRRDVVSRFNLEYAEALGNARVSADHTAQPGWQALYQTFYKNDRESRRRLAAGLKETAAQLEIAEIGEGGEKTIGELKKSVTASREAREIFEGMTVGPVRECVETCHKLISDARRQAEADYERAPMVNIGLIELMDDAVASVERVAWDSDEGRVLIKPPAKSDV